MGQNSPRPAIMPPAPVGWQPTPLPVTGPPNTSLMPQPNMGNGFFDPNIGYVGGGAATPVANQFTQWLSTFLGSGGNTNTSSGTPVSTGGGFDPSRVTPGNNPRASNDMYGPSARIQPFGGSPITEYTDNMLPPPSPYGSGAGQATGQTQDMMQVINNLLNGRVGDPTSLSQYFSAGLGSSGQANIGQSNAGFTPTPINVGFTPDKVTSSFNPQQIQSSFNPTQYQNFNAQQVQSLYNAPTYRDPNLQNVNTQFNLPNVNQISAGYNPTQLRAPTTEFNPGQVSQLQSVFQNQNFERPNTQFNPQQVQQVQSNYNPTALRDVNTNFSPSTISSVAANVPQYMAPQVNSIGVGNVGAGPVNPAANAEAINAIMRSQQQRDIADLRERFGNTALGTGAATAEALYRAESAPRIGLAIDDLTRQNNQLALTQRGQDIGQNQFAANVGLANNDQRMAAANALNQFNLSGAGMGLSAAQGNQGADIARMSAQLQAMGLSNDAILALNNQMINQGQFGAQQNLAAQGANQAAQIAGNAQQLQAMGLSNDAINALNQLNTQQNQFGAQQNLIAQQGNQQAQLAQVQAALQALGLTNDAALQFNNQNINQNQFGASQNLAAQTSNQNAQIAQLQAALQAAGLSNDAILGQNAQAIAAANNANQFAQNNAQFGSTQSLNAALANQGAAQQAAALNLQGLGLTDASRQFGATFNQNTQTLNNQFAQNAAEQQLQALIANQGAGLTANNQNLNAAQLNNQNALAAAQMLQNNQQFNINSALQNQQMGNQFNLGMQGIGTTLLGQQSSAQQNMIDAIMQALMQTQRIGIPQAETTVGPSTGQNWINAVGAIAPLAQTGWNIYQDWRNR